MAAATEVRPVIWQPQEGPQTFLLKCPVREIFFGGARGGGKSDSVLGHFVQHLKSVGGAANGIIFRRTAKQLEQLIERAKQIMLPTGAIWRAGKAEFQWRKGSERGASLKFRHLADADDAEAYQGQSYSWVCFEELGNWPDLTAYHKLKGSWRSAKTSEKWYLATGNPGGPGHSAVKAYFISPAPELTPITDAQSGEQRIYIPSRLEHNKILTTIDPHYERNLQALGAKWLVQAWRYGNWDIVAGGFFDDVWSPARHVVPVFEIPKTGWRFRRSFDWGNAKPSSLGLWAEPIDDTILTFKNREIFMPRHSMLRFGEWYTVEKDEAGNVKANVGLRIDNVPMGRRIGEISRGRQWSDCVADPSIFTEDGGESIFRQLARGAIEVGHGLVFNPADNTRKAGWTKMRDMLKESAKPRAESPGLWIMENCTDWLRTVPVLQRDPKNGDDVDTDGEDHAGDETRYAVNRERRVISFGKTRGA